MVSVWRFEAITMNQEKNQFDAFDQKLNSFEDRLNPRSSKKREKKTEYGDNPWFFACRAGVEVVSAFIVGLVIGYGLDYWLSTKPVFILIFSVLGMIAGIFNIWHLVKPNDIRLK
ncbi:AtpZ/AtpI family protein [Commensalibacter sp. M0270]|uniref:AtpZ/AtpI family protein n=2 Tax=Acetobacteraceae TaxID=433 RepID=UPI0018DBDDA9|nr:AtpZ/AtpI family protein [Commensalibacter sp. M0268]MBH9970222.1 AtpZ/AtpI family protein [Commensalibacter sp. M0265]MBH9993257.1 AtpZ/AtpI family protein [Commensalibacter sp. M0270]MBI0056422.1 AtpZ/AtpI family protein [Commensalibacter sp. M0268]